MKTKEWETRTEWLNRMCRRVGGVLAALGAVAGYLTAGVAVAHGEPINIAVGLSAGGILTAVAVDNLKR